MSIDKRQVRRIFYFNVNYACNNRCVFCYSHNTRVAKKYEELMLEEMLHYLDNKHPTYLDRIIVNGGEPLLHSEIASMLSVLQKYSCEVLVYTNGRLLKELPDDVLVLPIRYVVPVHGCQSVHDAVTRVPGSYEDTLQSISYVRSYPNCVMDMKVIINPNMIESDDIFNQCLMAYDTIEFNGSVHLTKMADTKVSLSNRYPSVDYQHAAIYTQKLFDYWKRRRKTIKVFDTCISHLPVMESNTALTNMPLKVYFKDCHLEKEIALNKSVNEECAACQKSRICFSAVDEYKTLEYKDRHYYENWE